MYSWELGQKYFIRLFNLVPREVVVCFVKTPTGRQPGKKVMAMAEAMSTDKFSS